MTAAAAGVLLVAAGELLGLGRELQGRGVIEGQRDCDVVAGLGLGYLLLRLMRPYVGPSLSVAYPPPVFLMDWTSLGIALAAILGATALALTLSARAMLRASVTGVLRGEAE